MKSYFYTNTLFCGFLCLSVLPVSAEIGQDFQAPETTVQSGYKSPVSFREARPLDGLPKGCWWAVFQDDQLDGLIEQATVNSESLKAAVARFDQARAVAQLARAHGVAILGSCLSLLGDGGDGEEAAYGNTAVYINYNKI